MYIVYVYVGVARILNPCCQSDLELTIPADQADFPIT